MVELSGITGGFASIVEGLKSFAIVALPLIVIGALFVVFFFIIKNRKMYNYDVFILRGTKTNLVQGYDRGGIVNVGSIRAFRLKNRKVMLSVPDDKYVIVNEKGGLSVYLDKFSDQDYRPVNVRRELVQAKLASGKSVEGYATKMDLSEGDSRNFHTQMSRELYNRHQTLSKLEKFAPFIGYAVVGVVFIFMIIWYFKYASVLADKGANCMDQVAGLAEACKQSLIPPGGGNLNL